MKMDNLPWENDRQRTDLMMLLDSLIPYQCHLAGPYDTALRWRHGVVMAQLLSFQILIKAELEDFCLRLLGNYLGQLFYFPMLIHRK